MKLQSFFLVALVSLWWASSSLAQDSIHYRIDDPDAGKFEHLAFPSKDKTYKKENEYVSIARKAVAQKMGPKFPVYDLDISFAFLRRYKDLPEAERNVIEVRLDSMKNSERAFAQDRVHQKMERQILVVLIRKDLKKISISARKLIQIPES